MKEDAAGGEAKGSKEADELEATGGAAGTGAGAAMRSKFCHGRSEPPKDVLDCRSLFCHSEYIYYSEKYIFFKKM